MQKEFYIGHKGGERCQSLDVSLFSSLEQLTKALADIFAFADTKCKFFLFLLKIMLEQRLIQDSIMACG